MRYPEFLMGALFWVGIALPGPGFGAEGGAFSDSASARITLRLPARVRFHPLAESRGSGRLCLSHIPADHYSLAIRPVGKGDARARRVAGSSGHFCVPVSASRTAKLVLIVAQ